MSTLTVDRERFDPWENMSLASSTEWLDSILARFEISRVADITRLDATGYPIFQAIRPEARTLKVSGGRGPSADEARTAAVMEAVELWHAEHVSPPILVAAVAEVQVEYDVLSLAQERASALATTSKLGWIEAKSLVTGGETLLPRAAVALDFTRSDVWRASSFFVSSTGLGAGWTFEQAALHALLEVIERDAVSRSLSGEAGRPCRLSPAELTGLRVDYVLEMLARNGIDVYAERFASPTGMPVFGAMLKSADFGLLASGYGANPDADVALFSAITEAIQTRVTYIAGARDDLSVTSYRRVYDDDTRFNFHRPPAHSGELPGFPHVEKKHAVSSVALNSIARCVSEAFGAAPIVATLSLKNALPVVVKIAIPGARLVQGAI